MDVTHVVFKGGTKDGTTESYKGLDVDSDLLFDASFEPQERYKRTAETVIVDGVEHVVFHLTV